jgi:hypothetical protein
VTVTLLLAGMFAKADEEQKQGCRWVIHLCQVYRIVFTETLEASTPEFKFCLVTDQFFDFGQRIKYL